MKKIQLLALLFTVFSFGQETVKLEINIVNRIGDVVFIRDLSGKNLKEIKLNDKGNFTESISLTDNLYLLFDGAEYAPMFLKNGYDLKINVNAKDFDNSIKYSGKGADENNYLAQATLLDQKYDYEGLLAMSEAEFQKNVEAKKNDEFNRLDKAKLDAKFVELQKKNIDMGMQGLKSYFAQIQKNKKYNATKAQNFDYLNHAGGKTSLESLKGKYVYIDIWATWCGPCRAEIPSLKKIEEKYHGKNIAFVSISVDTDKDFEKWKLFVTEKALGGIQLFADKNWTSDFIKSFEINSIPRFLLIDPNGVVVDSDAARPSNPKLQDQLDKLLQ